MKLNTLKDNHGATKDRMRVGRGIGSGKGKTAGRGVKGQKSRTGKSINGFEGGQMPIYMRMPKRGFNNYNAKNYQEVSLARLQKLVDDKVLDPKKTVTAEELKAVGGISSIKDGVRILGTGEIKTALQLEVTGATKSAIAAIEKAGGKVTILQPKVTTGENGKFAPKADKKTAQNTDKKTAKTAETRKAKKAAAKSDSKKGS